MKDGATREQYLDGLRGWAALAVLLRHTINGLISPGWKPHFQPLFSDGALAVYVFFVLSGFVLSIRCLKSGDRRDAIDLAIRRYPRLTIPIAAISMIAVSMVSFGIMKNVEAGHLANNTWLASFFATRPNGAALLHFVLHGVYHERYASAAYNPVLWTMPIEMQGSLLLFAVLLIVGRKGVLRFCGHVIFLTVTAIYDSQIFAIALGAAIANLSTLPIHQQLEQSVLSRWLSCSALIVGASYAALRSTNNQLGLSLCSAGLIYAVLLNKTLQGVLSSKISQWMGRLAFPLYLVHMLVICSFSSWLFLVLAEDGAIKPMSGAIILISTLVLSFLCAYVFYPIEKLGIIAGRRLSTALCHRFPTGLWPRRSNIIVEELPASMITPQGAPSVPLHGEVVLLSRIGVFVATGVLVLLLVAVVFLLPNPCEGRITMVPEAGSPYAGYLDAADGTSIAGWAWNSLKPREAVLVEIYDGRKLLLTAEASMHREELANFLGDCAHAFVCATPESLKDGRPHHLHVRVARSNFELKNSPRMLHLQPVSAH